MTRPDLPVWVEGAAPPYTLAAVVPGTYTTYYMVVLALRNALAINAVNKLPTESWDLSIHPKGRRPWGRP